MANLGRVLYDQKNLEEAEACFRRALVITPHDYRAHYNLASVLWAREKTDDAKRHFQEALKLKNDDPSVHLALGPLLQDQHALGEAEFHYRRAIELNPASAAAHNNLGVVLRAQGKLSDACEAFREAVRIDPQMIGAKNSLATVLGERGKTDEALACFQEVLALDPGCVAAHGNLGVLFKQQGRLARAIASFERALATAPDNAEVHSHLGASLVGMGRVDEGLEHCRTAVRLDPNLAVAHDNLASVLHAQGQLDESIAAYRVAVELAPDEPIFHSDLLYALNFHPATTPDELLAEHRRWARRHADPLTAQSAPHQNDRTADRRLRVGYVSPHFLGHAVNSFVEPILAAHDHATFEIFCYSDVTHDDDTTRRLRGYADHWRPIVGQTDVEVADLIRHEAIDILIDLTGHMAGGRRSLVFARKAAPIQVTYLGYQNTTGMAAMDYRLTDAYADPPGETDAYHTEQLVRLPRSFFTYLAPVEAAPVDSMPATRNGFVTFGSFNNFAKVTPGVLGTWAQVLARVDGSRLILLANVSTSLRRRVMDSFERAGVSGDRVELTNRQPYEEYLRLIQSADIVLDPFPFNGHTTTCDALWMGVPVIMLAGRTYASRFGGSALVNLELDDMIAATPTEYVEIAERLAADLDRLRLLRAGLRPAIAKSPILDAAGFTRNLEDAYRQMWRRWCAQ